MTFLTYEYEQTWLKPQITVAILVFHASQFIYQHQYQSTSTNTYKITRIKLKMNLSYIYSRVKNKWDYKGLEIFITRY